MGWPTRYFRASPCRNQPAVWALLLCCMLQAICAPGFAAELVVGPGAAFRQPSAAAAVARPGDTIRILPGTYYDCAVWQADDLTIEGSGEATRIADRICQGKAIFVVTGRNVRIRNLALARARHLDGHGAAIRAEGRNLSLDRVLIEDNQDGIFAPGLAGGMLRIERSTFRSNGAMPGSTPSAAVRAGSLDALLIRDTVFEDGQGKAAILSAAGWTTLEGCRIGGGAGLEGAAVMVEGGLRAVRNRVEAGSGPRGYRAGILALPSDRAQPLVVTNNQLEGDGLLLLNWSGQDMRLAENRVPPDALEASRAGAWWFALRQWLRSAWQDLRERAREVVQVLRRLGDTRSATRSRPPTDGAICSTSSGG
jgi:hypothetical protein